MSESGKVDTGEKHVKKSLFNGYIDLLLETFNPERRAEMMSSVLMWGASQIHDILYVPRNYSMARSLERQGVDIGSLSDQLPNDPALGKFLFDLGDIAEISQGFGALRIGLILFNQRRKNQGKEEFSDEQCFWGSLLPILLIKASHTLGLISLFGIHDHVGQPAYNLLEGQIFASTILIGSHYLTKYREPIGELASKIGEVFVKGDRVKLAKISNVANHVENGEIE